MYSWTNMVSISPSTKRIFHARSGDRALSVLQLTQSISFPSVGSSFIPLINSAHANHFVNLSPQLFSLPPFLCFAAQTFLEIKCLLRKRACETDTDYSYMSVWASWLKCILIWYRTVWILIPWHKARHTFCHRFCVLPETKASSSHPW